MSNQAQSVLFQQQQQQSQQYGSNPSGSDNLEFYSSNYNQPSNSQQYAYNPNQNFYNQQQQQQQQYTYPQGKIGGGGSGYGSGSGNGPREITISWKAAFGTGGFPDEPPLMEELGINFGHIKSKTMTVLNPMKRIDKHIMDDTDLAGPLLFCFLFGIFLLLSGKIHFSYIYGVAALGCLSMYAILNLMSESGIDGYRTASVLGYCLLPMVLLSMMSILLGLSSFVGLMLATVSVLWCTYSAATMFVTVLSMNEQRVLVAYPVGLLYTCFALMTVY